MAKELTPEERATEEERKKLANEKKAGQAESGSKKACQGDSKAGGSS